MNKRPTSHLQKRLTKHGNSLALVIDKAVLELLGVDDQTLLSIRTDGRCLIVTPTEADHPGRVRASMTKMHAKYAPALEKLAQ